MSNTVGVINYGSGNYRSLCNALDFLKINRIEITCQKDFIKADSLILPGVGSYGNCINRLKLLDLDERIKEEVLVHKKNFLGICVGMQILTNFGTEYGRHDGLGLISGSTNIIEKSNSITIPHIGWTGVEIKKDSKLFESIDNHADFYFVHSYCVSVDDSSLVSSVVEYGDTFNASIEHENIYGVQFHPEKSQKNGLQLLLNFSNL